MKPGSAARSHTCPALSTTILIPWQTGQVTAALVVVCSVLGTQPLPEQFGQAMMVDVLHSFTYAAGGFGGATDCGPLTVGGNKGVGAGVD